MSTREITVNRKPVASIGASEGLDTDCGGQAPEQIYVNLVEDPHRPIQIDGWVGWHSDSRLHVTRKQCTQLIALLEEAIKTQGYLDAKR